VPRYYSSEYRSITDIAELRAHYDKIVQDLKSRLEAECNALADYKKVTEPALMLLRNSEFQLTKRVCDVSNNMRRGTIFSL
jgi:hypothetical protein